MTTITTNPPKAATRNRLKLVNASAAAALALAQDQAPMWQFALGRAGRWLTSPSSINANLSNGTEQSYTFKRPSNSPGLATDMNYALEVEKLNEMQRQTEIQQRAKWDAERAARNAADAAEKARKKTYTCDRIGSTVHCF